MWDDISSTIGVSFYLIGAVLWLLTLALDDVHQGWYNLLLFMMIGGVSLYKKNRWSD